LAGQPRMGALYDSGIARLAGLRRFPVKGFRDLSTLLFARRKRP
jgi:hypothetical protein